ncbi:Transcriptional regulator, GntR family [Olavius algarvensis Delta 1 endosymbiont]|nr:Transcriptional regulator, GntR family [Olavius algarvensis Delta 1 endosymbiont]
MQKSATSIKTKKKSTSVRELAYNNLKSAVLAGRFNPGERLTEEHLAKSMGVSRTPVREALQKLESEGLVKPMERRGFSVARDSREEMEDLFDIRAALEGYAIRLICAYIDDESIDELQDLIGRAEKALQRKKLDEVFKFNTRFHDTLHDIISHKSRFHSLIADTRKYVLRYRKDSLHYLAGARRTIDGHKKIVLAISLKDPDLCERVMREHIEEAKEEALNKLGI